tara:strand:- start:240 stop:434 length:195 start_codon:yes stop_codon:yes gene_type:complete
MNYSKTKLTREEIVRVLTIYTEHDKLMSAMAESIKLVKSIRSDAKELIEAEELMTEALEGITKT